MRLKFKVKSKDEVPAELSSHNVERDGQFHMDIQDGQDEQDGGGKERPQMDKINTDWGKGRVDSTRSRNAKQ